MPSCGTRSNTASSLTLQTSAKETMNKLIHSTLAETPALALPGAENHVIYKTIRLGQNCIPGQPMVHSNPGCSAYLENLRGLF